MKVDRSAAQRTALLCALMILPVACAGDNPTTKAPAAPASAATAPAAPAPAAPAAPAAEAPAPAATANQPADADKPYSVECGTNPETGEKQCLVDKATYVGWRTFNSVCFVCHGQDAVGTTFAPSLVERLQQIDKERFMYVVHNGFQGQIGVMPAWKDNPNVNKHFEELYSYIKARSDGAMPTGRPERKPE